MKVYPKVAGKQGDGDIIVVDGEYWKAYRFTPPDDYLAIKQGGIFKWFAMLTCMFREPVKGEETKPSSEATIEEFAEINGFPIPRRLPETGK